MCEERDVCSKWFANNVSGRVIVIAFVIRGTEIEISEHIKVALRVYSQRPSLWRIASSAWMKRA